MGSYLTCNHSKPHFLYEAACSYCSLEFLPLCFWLQGPWGHYWALKTSRIPTCNPLTDLTHELGALFKFSLGLQPFQLQMLCDAGLQLSHSPDLALDPADPDLPHHYKLGWWFRSLMDSNTLPRLPCSACRLSAPCCLNVYYTIPTDCLASSLSDTRTSQKILH